MSDYIIFTGFFVIIISILSLMLSPIYLILSMIAIVIIIAFFNRKSKDINKYLIAGVIATITITGALAYLQYKKLMNYIIKVKTAVVKTITANLLDLDLTLDFENKSNISFEIKSQEYEVYIDNKFISKINNIKPVFIKAKSNSDIFVNIKVNPTKVGTRFKLEDLGKLLDLQNVKIKIIGKMKVKLYAFTINIPFNFETTIKELRENK